jgi:hypothetical protein
MKATPRFAVQILFYDCDNFILRTISNCAQFVERIYVTYSPEPWDAYNRRARSEFKNPSNPEILCQSPFYDKVTFIQGTWHTEEDQRNACLDKAREEGFDYLIIQDADEFYLAEDYKNNINEIILNPDYSYYRNPWYFFWKSTKYIVVNRHFYSYNNDVRPYSLNRISFNACFAINCRMKTKFENKRMPDNKSRVKMLSGICFHLSFVLSDESVLRKLSTWGHSHQVKIDDWLKVKWLAWTPSTRNFHPINLLEWAKVEEYRGKLPVELRDFDPGHQETVEATFSERLRYVGKEIYFLVIYLLKDLKFLTLKSYRRFIVSVL